MACRKYILTNNTNSNGVFSYQECSNQMLVNDLVIEPNVTLNIWLTTGTYRSATPGNISILDLGAFPFPPPASPTPTPSITASPTVTPTVTPTDSVTDTPTPTPTSTPTPSNTVTSTPTNTGTPTPTITPSQTPSFNFVVSNINTGSTYVEGVTGTTGTVTTKSGYSYPVNGGETLYADFTTSGGNLQFDVEIKDPSSADFLLRIKINGTTSQTFTPGPGDTIISAGPYSISVTDIVEVVLENN